MKLLNLLNTAEGTISESNYDEMQQKLNSTLSGSEVAQGLDLRMFLSDETWSYMERSYMIVMVIFVFYIVKKVRDKLTYLESKDGMFHTCH